ncbi:MAG: ABC transporter permease [Clostridia bacterium]
MNLLNKLTIKNLKLNKKRTIVTIIGIILSVALITAVASIYSSGIASLIEFETYEKGNFHYAFYDVPSSELGTFENNRKIEELYLTKHMGYAKLEESKNENKPYAHIMAFTQKALKNLSVQLIDGKLPQNENEIVIPSHLRTNGRVILNVGDKITLNVGTRVSDGEELNQNNPFYTENKEEIINTTQKTYRIVGIIERPATNIEDYYAPGYTFITYLNEENISGNIDIYTRYTKEGLKEQYKITANILGINEELFEKANNEQLFSEDELDEYRQEISKAKYNINVNTYLIYLETNPLEISATASLGVVAFIVCLIIVFTSVFCIKNSFDISITEKTKQYGMLRSVGATKKQIRKNVFYEAFILGIIGIPLGILLGIIASYILIIISNIFLENMMGNLKLKFVLSWIAVLFSIILGIITIYLSAIRSAKRASKISPIDSIRNSANIKIKPKKLKSPKIINSLFGIGGNISYKNLKRNKKKYRTTVISIIISVSIFIALSSFVDLAFLAVRSEIESTDFNISLYTSPGVDNTFYNKVIDTTKLENIEEYSILRQTGYEIKNPKYSQEYENKTNDKEMLNGYINIYSVGENSFKNFVKKLGLNYESVKDKAFLIDNQRFGEYNKEKNKVVYSNIREFAYNKGEKLLGKATSGDDQVFEIEIAYVTEEKPFGLSYIDDTMLIISDELFNEKFVNGNNERDVHVYYKSSNPDKLQDDIEEYLKEYDISINNMNENVKMQENLFTLVAIFLYGFIIVISLIGVTNIFNTITTNMQLRKQEFAMLKSVGMTKKEFSRMIRLESIFMGLKSLIFGLPIGIALSYLIYHFLAKDSGIAYPIPFGAIIIAVVTVFILITCIMKYSMNKINKQNTIETIRNENI